MYLRAEVGRYIQRVLLALPNGPRVVSDYAHITPLDQRDTMLQHISSGLTIGERSEGLLEIKTLESRTLTRDLTAP